MHCYALVVPRVVDAPAQRAELAAAVTRIVARGGLEQVSLRSVAAEAGVSMGRVQHYFATKDDLLLHALDAAYQGMERRIEARVSARIASGAVADEAVAAWTALAEILDELLGAHPQSRDAIRVTVAFGVRAHGDPRVIAKLTEGDDEIIALAISVVAAAREAGRVPADTDADMEGRALFALACGLGVDVVLHGAPVRRARQVLRHRLDQLRPASHQG